MIYNECDISQTQQEGNDPTDEPHLVTHSQSKVMEYTQRLCTLKIMGQKGDMSALACMILRDQKWKWILQFQHWTPRMSPWEAAVSSLSTIGVPAAKEEQVN